METFYINASHYKVQHCLHSLCFPVPFETNLCLPSMNQEICQRACVIQASMTESVCEVKVNDCVCVRGRVTGNESDMGCVLISHIRRKI